MAARIAPLADHPGLAPRLARWHHAEWAHLYSDWTLEAAEAELRDHAGRTGLPTTLVALDGADCLGSASLVEVDAPDLGDRGQAWLASLYVRPDARGQGLGASLVHAIVALAAREGLPRLCLFTPGQSAFYARLGWRRFDAATLRGEAVELMEITPA